MWKYPPCNPTPISHGVHTNALNQANPESAYHKCDTPLRDYCNTVMETMKHSRIMVACVTGLV